MTNDRQARVYRCVVALLVLATLALVLAAVWLGWMLRAYWGD